MNQFLQDWNGCDDEHRQEDAREFQVAAGNSRDPVECAGILPGPVAIRAMPSGDRTRCPGLATVGIDRCWITDLVGRGGSLGREPIVPPADLPQLLEHLYSKPASSHGPIVQLRC